MNRVRPILRWPGGKSRMLKHLLPLIPPHVCYCEPFAGGLAVLLAKDRSKVEVVNDINGELVGLYRNLQYHLPELLREINWLFSSRKNLNDFTTQPGLTEIQRASRYILRSRISFSGTMRGFSVAGGSGGGPSFSRKYVGQIMAEAHQRLDGVIVENISYDHCIDLYDSKDTFFFFDPPYLNADPGAYVGWTEKEIQRFRRRLRRVKGNWMVTLDDSPFNREQFRDCNVTGFTWRNGCVKARTQGAPTFGELIITPK